MKILFAKTILIVILFLPGAKGECQIQQPVKAISEETLNQWMQDLSNWGRWGMDDQLGTLNLKHHKFV